MFLTSGSEFSRVNFLLSVIVRMPYMQKPNRRTARSNSKCQSDRSCSYINCWARAAASLRIIVCFRPIFSKSGRTKSLGVISLPCSARSVIRIPPRCHHVPRTLPPCTPEPVRVEYSRGGFMNIVEALHSEEAKLQRQLTAVKSAIAALNGGSTTAISSGHTSSPNGTSGKRTMSAAVRARISRKAKARWAKIRAEKSKKAK